jgi:hypothetical protein
LCLALLTVAAMTSATLAFSPEAQTKARPQDRFEGVPNDPIGDLERRAAREMREKRFRELKDSAVEMAELSRKVSDDLEKGGQDVISTKVFENLDKIEKLVKQVRNKAKDGY